MVNKGNNERLNVISEADEVKKQVIRYVDHR